MTFALAGLFLFIGATVGVIIMAALAASGAESRYEEGYWRGFDEATKLQAKVRKP